LPSLSISSGAETSFFSALSLFEGVRDLGVLLLDFEVLFLGSLAGEEAPAGLGSLEFGASEALFLRSLGLVLVTESETSLAAILEPLPVAFLRPEVAVASSSPGSTAALRLA
jgi:hypothetical protein